MLASKIEDFLKLWPSKRPSKFHPFSHRFFIDFGSVLASNMGPSWEPRRLKIRKNGSQNFSCSSPRAVLDTEHPIRPFWHRFWGVRARFSKIFGWFFELLGLLWTCFRLLLLGGLRPPQTPPLLTWSSLFLVRSSANSTKKIQELAEDKAENPRTCRGQSREENPYERLQENSNLQAFFFQTPFLIARVQTPKTLGGGTPPRGASINQKIFRKSYLSI